MTRKTFPSLEALTEYLRSMPPDAHHVLVLHEDECTPDHCVCSPEYVLEELTVENVERGRRDQERWRAFSNKKRD